MDAIGHAAAPTGFTPGARGSRRQTELGPLTAGAARGSIVVEVEPAFVPDDSEIALPKQSDSQYLFTYFVRIINNSTIPITVMHRHWIIVDADGERRDIRGEGVVGRQPRLEPGGEPFEYASYCPMPTAWGTMEGSLACVTDDDRWLDIAVGRFYLVADTD